jgi:hypothetical protein
MDAACEAHLCHVHPAGPGRACLVRTRMRPARPTPPCGPALPRWRGPALPRWCGCGPPCHGENGFDFWHGFFTSRARSWISAASTQDDGSVQRETSRRVRWEHEGSLSTHDATASLYLLPTGDDFAKLHPKEDGQHSRCMCLKRMPLLRQSRDLPINVSWTFIGMSVWVYACLSS